MKIHIEFEVLIPDAIAITQLNTIWEVLNQENVEGSELKDFLDGLSYVMDVLPDKNRWGSPLIEDWAAEAGSEKALSLRKALQSMIEQIDNAQETAT